MEVRYNTRSPAVKRLMREAQELAEPTYDYFAQPLSDNLFEWHFTVRGPADTDFDGGVYHGRIVLPPDYPMKPPNIIVLTPNGRFETGKKICLSISGHHPESWQPSWSIRTALLAIIGFMPTPSQGTIGSLDYPSDERKKLAKKSVHFTCPDCGGEGPVADLLKCKSESVDESDNSLAQEAKEIIKTMSLKGESEKKTSTATEEAAEESEDDKYKRARKLYSARMQNLIRQRLNQPSHDQNSSETSSNSSSSRASEGQPTPTHQSSRPSESSARPTSTSPGRQRRQTEQRNRVQEQNATLLPESRNYAYDIVIAIIVVVIALLLYRRISLHSSDVTPTTSPDRKSVV